VGKTFPCISDEIRKWIGRQRMFFIASAPLSDDGMVNCSPKGGDTLRVVDKQTLAYLEFAGSGVETIAHLRENGRIVLMMCAFEGPPRIFRFHGKGEVVLPSHRDFAALSALYNHDLLGVRSVIRIRLERISDSCGYGVPLYEFVEDRKAMRNWCEKKGAGDIKTYVAKNNAASIDGLPGLTDKEAAATSPTR